MFKNNEKRCAHSVYAIGILTFLTTLFGVIRNYSPVPYWDQWNGAIDFYMKSKVHPLAAFFGLHNEHRLFISRLIFYPDVGYFGGRDILGLIADLVFSALISQILYRVVVRHIADPNTTRFVFGVSLIYMFSWSQNENFTSGFQNQWFAVYLFAICAFHSLEVSSELRESGQISRSGWWFLATLGSATLSTLSMASGLLVPAILVMQAIYLKQSRLRIGILILGTLVLWIAYFSNWKAAANGGSPIESHHYDLVALTEYILLYLGSPASVSVFLLPRLAWGIMILGGVAYSLKLALRNNFKPYAISLLAMALMIVGSAAITAIGRLNFLGLYSAMAIRYRTAALVGMYAVLFFLWLNESEFKRKKWVQYALIGATLMVVAHQVTVLRAPKLYGKTLAGLALRSHVYDPKYTGEIFSVDEVATLHEIASQAEVMGLSIFAPDQTDYDETPRFVSASGQCVGTINDIMVTMTPGVLAARGWVFDPQTRAFAHSIVIADALGNGLGIGLTGDYRPELSGPIQSNDKFGGWVGFFNAPKTSQIQVFGKLGPDRYCSLPSLTTIPGKNIDPSQPPSTPLLHT